MNTYNVNSRQIWDGSQIALERTPTGLRLYYYGLGRYASRDEAGRTAFYIYNTHNDVVKLVGSGGNVIHEYDYDAFGVERSPDAADANPWRYCGEYWDGETSSIYLRARYYSPGMGRFGQEDTHWNTGNMVYGDSPDKDNPAPKMSSIRQSGNLYLYCLANPIMFFDPDGHYNRDDAVSYAQKWYNGRNEEYYSYSQDCANFVSQSLFAGGITMNDSWHSYKNEEKDWKFDPRAWIDYKYRFEWDVSENWRLAKSQYDFFSNADNGYINGDVITIGWPEGVKAAAENLGIKKGDLMYFAGEDGKNPHHAVIITKVQNGEIYFAGHTNPAFDKPLSKNIGKEKVLVVRIKDDV